MTACWGSAWYAMTAAEEGWNAGKRSRTSHLRISICAQSRSSLCSRSLRASLLGDTQVPCHKPGVANSWGCCCH